MTSILAFIRGLGIWTTLASVAVALVTMWGAYKIWENVKFNEGVQHERTQTEKANEAVIQKGRANAEKRRQCVDAYGVHAWDVTDGLCKPSQVIPSE